MTDLRLSLLDLNDPIDTVEIAELAEHHGFSRLWLAEHHGPGARSGSPEVLVPVIAGLTEHLRVGTAGILLSYYSPLKVAETFRALEHLFPGRIDLGFCRGAPNDAVAHRALRYAEGEEVAFETRAADLVAFLAGTPPAPHRWAGVAVAPRGAGVPAAWCVGTGERSARLAGELGTSFAYGVHLGGDDPRCLEIYREVFQRRHPDRRPECVISIAGLCGDDATIRTLDAIGPLAIKAPVLGPPSTCRERLVTMADRYGVSEIVWLDLALRQPDRLRSIADLADAIGLARRSPP